MIEVVAQHIATQPLLVYVAQQHRGKAMGEKKRKIIKVLSEKALTL